MDERPGEAATDLHAAILLHLDMHLGIPVLPGVLTFVRETSVALARFEAVMST